MAKTARLELRVEPELKARLEARADELGQKLTTFVERALESALGTDLPPSGEQLPSSASSRASGKPSVRDTWAR